METTKTYTQVQNEWQGGHVYEVKCLCSRGWEWGRNGTLAKGCFLSESEIDISNCQTHMPNHYLKVEILKLSSIIVSQSQSWALFTLMSNHPIMFIFFLLLTTFGLSFVLSSTNKNSFAGLRASWKCQLCTDHTGGKIQMTKFKIVKQHICLAMKISPIFFWLYPTFSGELTFLTLDMKSWFWESVAL